MEREKNGGLGAVVGLFWVSDSKEKKRAMLQKKNKTRYVLLARERMCGAGWEKKVNKKRHVPITSFGCLGWAGFGLFYFIF